MLVSNSIFILFLAIIILLCAILMKLHGISQYFHQYAQKNVGTEPKRYNTPGHKKPRRRNNGKFGNP